MRRFCCMALLLLAGTAAAEVRTILEPREVDEMDTVRLTLRVSGTAQLEAPDFSALEDDFEILGTQSSSRLSSINGRTSAVVEYQISLRPRHTGRITLPRLKIGDGYSEPLELNVAPMDPRVRDAIASMIFFETELTANPVYVQAQTVLIRRLYYGSGVQIYSDLPGIPDIPNAVVEPLGDTRSTTAIRDGRRYGVIEQRFAIFPEQSGTLEIPSISVTSSVKLQTGGRTRRSGIRVSTEAETLKVLPIPAEYPAGEPWLPAQSVALEQTWEPDRSRFDVGEPVKVRVDALLVGNVASAIPPVSLPLPDDSFKIYPEAPELSEDTAGAQVVGRRTEHYALVPTRPGQINLPARGLTWWDTSREEVRRTELPAELVTIEGAVAAPPPAAAEPSETAASGEPAAEKRADETQGALPLADLAPWLALLAGLAVLVALLAVAVRYAPRDLLARLPAPPGRRATRQLKTLDARCREGDVHGAKRALVTTLSSAWRCPPQDAVRRFREDPEAAATLKRLDLALYGASEPPPDLRGLPKLVRAALARRQPTETEGLPALYG